ncbi:MAG TPA: CHAT domain-containing tetratricopeptide repeat protein [Candidatus Aquilonibacter sp.]|nr:CHAT domain-containing tetratricopeptide repeat protein [Candidatus Aquilonibacter sp.]
MSLKAATQTEVAAMVERLLAAEGDSQRRSLISQHPEADWEEVISILSDRVREEIHVNTTKAQLLADLAMLAAETIHSDIGLARSHRAKANALYAMDRHAEAIELHRCAAELFERIGEKQELARTLSGSIQPFLLLGRYDEALAAGEKARAIFSEAGNAWRLARLEINIGNIFQRQDRFAEAFEHYTRAYEELIKRDDAEGLAAVLSNLSLSCIFLNDFPKALEFHRKARGHCEEKGLSTLVAYADYNIAYLYFLRGEYGRAIQMLRGAATSAKKAGDAYQLALCDLDLSEIYIELNLNAEATELARRAHVQFQKLGFGYEGAKALAFAAIAASRQGQAFEAVKLFTQAKEMFLRDDNQVWPALIDLYKALVLLNEGRLFEARQLCINASEFFRTSALQRKAAFAELLLARILFRMSDLAGARQRVQAALEHVAKLDSPVLIYDGEFLLGEIARTGRDQNEAYAAYSRARGALETLRGSLRNEELKIAFFSNKSEVYERLVELCLQRPDGAEEAFSYIEQAKSRTLTELLAQPVHNDQDKHTESDPGQSDLVRSIRNLREELNWYYNLIEREQLQPQESSPVRIENLERQARTRETALLRSLQEATDLEATQAGFQRTPSVALEQVQAALPEGAAMVEYFCAHDRVLACILNRLELRIVSVTVQSRIQKLLQLLQFQLSKFRLDPQYVAAFHDSLLQSTQAHLKNLYQELIAPLPPIQAEHLVFVPHGLLHYVPMHALHDGEKYLIDQFAISYAPSASIFTICQGKTASAERGALVLGIPDPQAPAIAEEASALGKILSECQVFLGEAATHRVLEEYGRHSRIIHIATHGYFRQDNPMFSSIRLGDSYLSLYDLYQLKLSAELVVLSGCATGLNVVKTGDEQIGLVRGLLQAGAQSMILSLWDVHDASTRDFMVAFYTALQRGMSKPLALQAAMLELRKKHPHPYHWAPFLLIGKA